MAIGGYIGKSANDAIEQNLIDHGVREKGKISNLAEKQANTSTLRKKKAIKIYDHTAEVRFYSGGNAFANIKLDDYLDGNKPAQPKGSVTYITFVDQVSSSFYNSAKKGQEVEIIYLKEDPKGTAKILYNSNEVYFEPYSKWLFYMGVIITLGLAILLYLYIKTGKSY